MSVRIHLLNKHHGGNPDGEYIGRGSPLGNPYSHLPQTTARYRVKTRADAVAAYQIWLDQQIQQDNPVVVTELERLEYLLHKQGELSLLCFCVPALCHGEVIRDILIKRMDGHD